MEKRRGADVGVGGDSAPRLQEDVASGGNAAQMIRHAGTFHTLS